MPHLRDDAKFLTHIQSTQPDATYVVSKEMKPRLGQRPAVREIVFLAGNQASFRKVTCDEEEPEIKASTKASLDKNAHIAAVISLGFILGGGTIALATSFFPATLIGFTALLGLTTPLATILPILAIVLIGSLYTIALLGFLERVLTQNDPGNSKRMSRLIIICGITAGIGLGLFLVASMPSVLSAFTINAAALGAFGPFLPYIFVALLTLFLTGAIGALLYRATGMGAAKVASKPAQAIEQTTEEPAPAEKKSFLRIFNVETFFPSSEAALSITPAEYKAAQRLGLTKNIDQAITAKVIGLLGDFRFESRRDAVVYGLLDDAYIEEEAICQLVFDRLEGLQELERAHGGSPAELKVALANYRGQLALKIQVLEDVAPEKRNVHQRLLLESYQRDNAQALALLNKAGSEEATAPASPENAKKNSDLLKNDLEAFLHDRLNEAIRHGRETDELVTTGSRINPFRGRLTGALLRADQLVTEHRFDQNRRAEKTHQGDYSEKVGADGRVTLTSFDAQLGDPQKAMERFMLTAALVMGDPHSPEDPLSPGCAGQATWSSAGWARVVKRISSGKPEEGSPSAVIGERYQAYLNQTEGAKLGFWSVAFQDLGNLLYDGGKALLVSFASAGTTFYQCFVKLRLDFTDLSQRTAEQEKESKTETEEELAEKIRWNSMSLKEQVADIFTKISSKLEQDRIAHSPTEHAEVKTEKEAEDAKAPSEEKKLTPEEDATKAKQERMRKIIQAFITRHQHHDPDNKEVAPRARPPHSLIAYNPDDLLSVGVGGLESFFKFFSEFHDENPSICVYAMACYLITIGCMAAPAAVTAAVSKAGIPLESFAKLNQTMAAAMASGDMAQITTQAFTNWQIITTVLEALIGGEESLIGMGADFTRRHFIEVVAGVLSVYGVGVLLTELVEPLQEELGQAPFFLQFFTGLKAVVLGYEGFESAPHERSIVGNFFADLIDFAFLTGIRCPLSILNFLYMVALRPLRRRLFTDTRPLLEVNGANLVRPWAELLHKGISALLRVGDAVLRGLNLVGRMLKMFAKAFTDFVFAWLVFLTKVVPILLLFVVPFFWPLVYLIRHEIVETFKGMKDDGNVFITNPRAELRRMILKKAFEQSGALEAAGAQIGGVEKTREAAALETANPPRPANEIKTEVTATARGATASAIPQPQKSPFLKRVALKVWHGEATPFPEWLLRAKFALFGLMDRWVTRPFKDLYKAGRNLNARYLNRREAHIDKRIVGWFESRRETAASEQARMAAAHTPADQKTSSKTLVAGSNNQDRVPVNLLPAASKSPTASAANTEIAVTGTSSNRIGGHPTGTA